MKIVKYSLDILLLTIMIHLTNGEVIDITKKNYNTLLEKKKYMIIYVTTPKCQECMVSYPKFAMTSELYSKNDIIFGRIKSKTLAAEFNVDTFPTVVYSLPEDVTWEKYTGEVTVDTLIQLISDEMSRDLSVIEKRYILDVTLNNYKELTEISNVSKFVLVYDDVTDRAYETMHELSRIYKNDDVILFLRVNSKTESTLIKELKPRKIPCVFWVDRENKRKFYAGEMILPEIMGFIAVHTGAHRQKDGSLLKDAGRIEALDKFIAYHVKEIQAAKDMKNIVKKAESLAEKQDEPDKEFADYYVHLLKLIAGNGSDDIARLREDLLDDLQYGKHGPRETENFVKRLNIINVIVEEFGNLMFNSQSALYLVDEEEDDTNDEQTDFHQKIHRHEEL